MEGEVERKEISQSQRGERTTLILGARIANGQRLY